MDLSSSCLVLQSPQLCFAFHGSSWFLPEAAIHPTLETLSVGSWAYFTGTASCPGKNASLQKGNLGLEGRSVHLLAV